MANPYEWSDEREQARRYDSGEDEARRAAERRDEEERERLYRDRQWDRHRPDYGARWHGDDAFYQRYGEPEAHRRERHEHRDERRAEHGPRHRSFEEEARHAGRSLARGWRRLTEGARHTFADDRGPAEHDPRRAGGMFGGRDRPGSLFNHDDGHGLSARPGSHRGKGPSGYVRGDERILEEVCDRLTEDDRLDASGIEVKVDAGEVTLNGQVGSREDKRRAEDVAESVSGVKHLQNNIRVHPPEAPQAQPAAQPVRRAAPEPAAPTSAQITDQRRSPTPRPRTPRPN